MVQRTAFTPHLDELARRKPDCDREVSLREMLADPIIQTVMRRDRVTPDAVEALFAGLRRNPRA